MPLPLVTTFKTAGTYKKKQYPNSVQIKYAWHVLLLWHTYLHTYIYIYHTSSNLYIPDSVSLANTHVHTPLASLDVTKYLSCYHCLAISSPTHHALYNAARMISQLVCAPRYHVSFMSVMASLNISLNSP